MHKSERQHLILNEDLSTRRAITAVALSYKYAIHQRSIYRDLLELETRGLAYCINPGSKPQEWLATRDSSGMTITTEQACGLCAIKEIAQDILPTPLFEALFEVFQQADKVMDKTRNKHPRHNTVRFERSTKQVDLFDEIYQHNLTPSVLQAINEALYADFELEIVLQDAPFPWSIKPVGLQKLDGKIILKGKMSDFPHSSCNINAADIMKACCVDYPSFVTEPRPRRAA